MQLKQRGDAVVVIEHHIDLLRVCDELVELGPTGGNAGGRIIATGTPAELIKNKDSITGPWLKPATKAPSAKKKTSSKKKKATRKKASPKKREASK